ncbi:MAG: hypothetical protein ACOX6N_02495 [Patescibacteria group bacterium]
MITKNYTFNFDTKIDQEDHLKKLISKAYLKNQKFFGQDVSGVQINFLYTHSQMDKACGQKTPDWLVGYAKNKQIFIFSPSVIDQVSSHPASDFLPTLTHELAHIFSNQLLNFYYPIWLYEGLAGNIAKQYKLRKIKTLTPFAKLHDHKNWNQNPNYPQSYSFTKYLIDSFGKETIIDFLKQLPEAIGRHHYPKGFSNFFVQYFRIDFDEFIQQWARTHR